MVRKEGRRVRFGLVPEVERRTAVEIEPGYLTVADPLNDDRPREVGSSGTLTGIFARTDRAHGVWKAPPAPRLRSAAPSPRSGSAPSTAAG